MSNNKIIQALGSAAGSAGGASLNVEDVFSTYLYDGTGSAQTITNGIDLDGEGGLVWLKGRDSESYAANVLVDTERGRDSLLSIGNTSSTSSIGAELITSSSNRDLTSFNSNGFSLNTDLYFNKNTNLKKYTSWTFRKAPKFFDVVTYTGDGVAGRAISHNLGSTPGCIIVKKVSATSNWYVWHRGKPSNNGLLNNTDPVYYTAYVYSPTSSDFSVFASDVNVSGETYVAYVFAHNDGDGEFGPDGDQDIIKCGSYTGDGSSGQDIDIGFEPQLVMVKRADSAGAWYIVDSMRGFLAPGGINSSSLLANAIDDESAVGIKLSSTGMVVEYNAPNTSGGTYIYMAIRRGPMGIPESASDVFAIDGLAGATSPDPWFTSNFVTDLALLKLPSSSGSWLIGSRLQGTKRMFTDLTNSETDQPNQQWDYMDGVYDANTNSSYLAWMWKRAPGFFDVVSYGPFSPGSAKAISHNLGIAPEMIWVKSRGDNGAGWVVYHKDVSADPETDYLVLSDTNAVADGVQIWNDTAPTATTFTVGTSSWVQHDIYRHIAYLFASLDGISKVGSYTGNGSSQTIDCGFSSGARFVLIKGSSFADNWWVFDTERGIVAGDDPRLYLNTTGAQFSFDYIDPHSSGFTVNSFLSSNGQTYIFYAVA